MVADAMQAGAGGDVDYFFDCRSSVGTAAHYAYLDIGEESLAARCGGGLSAAQDAIASHSRTVARTAIVGRVGVCSSRVLPGRCTLLDNDKPTPAGGIRKRVLLVDDEPLVCRALERVLLRHDYDVYAVGSSDDALDELRIRCFFAMVVDYDLGAAKGDVLLAAAAALRPVPFRVLISARQPPTKKLRDLGVFDAFLVKPFATGALLELLTRLRPRR